VAKLLAQLPFGRSNRETTFHPFSKLLGSQNRVCRKPLYQWG
jgi:hypothetical protein